MLSELKIKNFRCFKELNISGIKPLTLFTGKNNVGKSTVVEAIFLLLNYNVPEVFFKLNYFRGVIAQNIDSDTLWGSIFHDQLKEKPFSISAKFNRRNLELEYTKGKETFALIQRSGRMNRNLAKFAHGGSIECLDFKLLHAGGKREGAFVIAADGVKVTQNDENDDIYNSYPKVLMKNTRADIPVPEAFSEIDLNGRKESVVEVLRHIDERIRDVSLVMRNGAAILYADIGSGRKIPVSAMGDGVNNLLLIVLMIMMNPGGIILLDEIETGFHHSSLKNLWEMIARFAKAEQCQIIATTHSYECIRSALSATKTSDMPSDFTVIRLDRDNDAISAKVYDGETIDFALEKEVEVR